MDKNTFTDEGLWVIFWLATIALFIALPTAINLMKLNSNYHDECISSHVEHTEFIVQLKNNSDKYVITSDRLNVLIKQYDLTFYNVTPYWFGDKTICDKYALVRNATENGQ